MKLLNVHALLMGRSLGTLAEFLEHGSIQESPGKYPDEWTMISNLLADHEQIVRSLRTYADKCEEYHDMGTRLFDWYYGKTRKEGMDVTCSLGQTVMAYILF
jgi:DNA-binding ferritin-like protein